MRFKLLLKPPQFSGIFSPATVVGYVLISIWPEVKKKYEKKDCFQKFKKSLFAFLFGEWPNAKHMKII